MLGKQETLDVLTREHIPFDLVEHEPVATVAAGQALWLPFAADVAKNLFVRDDKKRAWFLISLRDERTCTLKELQARLGSRRLSFASTADLARMLGLAPGSVTPLGALNDAAHAVEVVIDRSFITGGRIAVHPCENTATIHLATADLVGLLARAGEQVRVLDLDTPLPDAAAPGAAPARNVEGPARTVQSQA